ncbi:MAG: hypothetical protein J1E97_00705 [Muribaculaceae bacterium]|nr:hypothetical protein [Muribaculaceae bacterium]
MIINLNDDDFRGFLQEIIENQALNTIFSNSPYWGKGEQAIQLICNSQFKSYPQDLIQIIQHLIDDVCPEQCEGGCNIGWNQMSTTLINGDSLCDYHHNLKEKLDKE